MLRALVVDDDEGIRVAMRMLLEGEGYVVEEAADGEEALEALRWMRGPAVVLLDYMMPHLDGGDVLRAVAADPVLATAHAYLLVTAGHLTAPHLFATLLNELGVVVLAKPFDIGDLLSAVDVAARRLRIAEE